MKRSLAVATLFVSLVAVLLCAAAGWAQISTPTAACAVASSSCSISAPAGTLQYAFAGRNGSSGSTPPSLPSGWTSPTGTSCATAWTCGINGASSADSSARLACRVSTSNNQASGTFTNAGTLIIINVPGALAGTTASCAGTISGAPQWFATAVDTLPTTETFASVVNSHSSSWDLAFGYAPLATAGIATAPAGMTNITSQGTVEGAHSTGAPVAGFNTANVTLTTGSRIITAVVEVKAAQVATPTYDKPAGKYSLPMAVTISDSTAGASIVFCTDTTNTCTPATAYSGPVTIAAGGTYLRAQASKTGMSPSAVQSALYTAPPYPNIWPFCDGGHPCLTQHMSTWSDGLAGTDSVTVIKLRVDSTGDNNAIVIGVTRPSAKTITLADNSGVNVWGSPTVTTTYAADSVTSDLWVLCGAKSASEFIFTASSPLVPSDVVAHFTINRIAGIATSDCVRASAGNNTLTGTVTPGGLATSAGDLVFLYAHEGYI